MYHTIPPTLARQGALEAAAHCSPPELVRLGYPRVAMDNVNAGCCNPGRGPGGTGDLI